ncbi:MAG: glycosyltransferase family 9 protein [Verrucomicrobiota bacterium]
MRGGAIGDFILTLPVLAALRAQFPDAHIEVLGYPHIIELAVAGGLVQRAQPIEARAMAAFFGRGTSLSPDLADYFSEFDIIVSYLYDPDLIFQSNVAQCTQARFIAGPHRPDDRESVHASRVFLRPLESLAIFDPDPHPRLDLAADVSPEPPALALHPGSGSESKNWTEPGWRSLLESLLKNPDERLLLIGGEAEGGRIERLAAGLPPGRVSTARNWPLTRLARRLAACSGFVGHDSGISHLAAALGVPCLLLWGQTNARIWSPPHRHVCLIQSPDGIHSIKTADVLSGIQRRPGPPPAGSRHESP